MFLINPYVFAAAAGADPYFANVSLLLHFEGADGSTTYTDNSPSPLTITPHGAAQIDTAEFKFGTSSGLFDGSTAFLSAPDVAAMQMGASDFTIEFFVRFVAGGTTQVVYEKRPVLTARGIVFFRDTDNKFYIFAGDSNNSGWEIQQNSPTALANGTWYHVAMSRAGNNFKSFLDGVKFGDNNNTFTIDDGSGSTPVFGVASGVTAWLGGWIDEFRVTKGVARYSANFTPPAAPFPDS